MNKTNGQKNFKDLTPEMEDGLLNWSEIHL